MKGKALESVGGRVAIVEPLVVERVLDGVSGGTTTAVGNLERPAWESHGIVGHVSEAEAGTGKVGDLTFVFILLCSLL